MNYLIQDHLDLVSSADDNRLTRQMSDLKKSGGTDLYDLLPKMMGAYAKRAKNDDVKKSMLSNVLNAIDNAIDGCGIKQPHGRCCSPICANGS